MRVRFLAGALLALFVSSNAFAEDRPLTTPRWYGWQTLLVDTTAIAATTVGINRNNGPAALAGVVLYELGSPAVHAFHGRGTIGLADFGVRSFAPFVGAMAGMGVASLGCKRPADCAPGGAIVGFVAGTTAAITVDAAVFSLERPPTPDEKNEPASPPSREDGAPSIAVYVTPLVEGGAVRAAAAGATGRF